MSYPKPTAASFSFFSDNFISGLLSTIDPLESISSEAQEVLVSLARQFIIETANFAAMNAKERKSDKTEAIDVQFALKSHWEIELPSSQIENKLQPHFPSPTPEYLEKLRAARSASINLHED